MARTTLTQFGFFDLLRVGELVGGGDHLQLAVAPEGFGETVDELGRDQGLVALDVDEVGDTALQPCGDLRDAVGAARVVVRCHGDLRAETESRLGDAHVVGGDDHVVQPARALGPLPDLLDHWLARDRVQGLARETGGTPARGDDADDLAHLFSSSL